MLMIQSWMTYSQQGLIPGDNGPMTVTQCMQIQYHIPMAINQCDVIQARSADHFWHALLPQGQYGRAPRRSRRIMTGRGQGVHTS